MTTSFGPLTAQLDQHAEHGRMVDGVFVAEHVHHSIVSSGNRCRIITREKPRGGTWVDGCYQFASHPDLLPDLAEYLTRIRWTPTHNENTKHENGEHNHE